MAEFEASPVFISAKTAERMFRWKDGIAALQSVYALPAVAAAIPPRTVAADDHGWLRTLPAMPPGCRNFGAKLMGISFEAPESAVEYVIVLFDRATSSIAAFVDAAQVTAYRTAATSAAAVDRMAKLGPQRVALLGSGLEASMHLRALAEIRPLSAIRVFSPTAAKRVAFARAMADELGLPIEAAESPEGAVGGADIVVATARSHGEKPILLGEWLAPDTLVVSIGSTVPSQREIDVSVVEKAQYIICDMLDEVIVETGDMIAAVAAGIDVRSKCRTLQSLMIGEAEPMGQSPGIRMFKSVGSGLQDIVIAELILNRAIEAGLTEPTGMIFERKRV